MAEIKNHSTQARLQNGQILKFWKEIKQSDWLDVLNEYAPASEWSAEGSTIKGKCPFHSDNTPSFVIAPERQSAHCFGAGCKVNFWDPIQFIARLSNQRYAVTLRTIRSRLGLRIAANIVQDAERHDERQEMLRALLHVMRLELMEALQDPCNPEFFYIQQSGLLPWLQTRALPLDRIHTWPVGVVMTVERFTKRMKAEKLDDIITPAYAHLRTYMGVSASIPIHSGCIAFFNHTAPGVFGKIKIRIPNSKSMFIVEDALEENVGYFGLDLFSHIPVALYHKYPLHIVEGEFDALALYAHNDISRDDLCVVSTSGSMVNNFNVLEELGFKDLYVLPDNDEAGLARAMDLLRVTTHIRRVFEWRPEHNGIKDPDEAFRSLGAEDFLEFVHDKENYLPTHVWALRRLQENIEGLSKDDLRDMRDQIERISNGIRSVEDREAFLDGACALCGVKRSSIEVALPPDVTEREYEDLVTAFIQQQYLFLCKSPPGASANVLVWNNRTKTLEKINPGTPRSTQVSATLAAKKHVLDSIKENIGVPDCIKMSVTKRGAAQELATQVIDKRLEELSSKCFLRCVSDVSDYADFDVYTKGVYCVDDFVDGYARVYVANGNQCYAAQLDPDNPSTKFSVVSSPIVEGRAKKTLFLYDTVQWSRNINTLRDIQSGENYDLKELYTTVRNILNTYWAFEQHDHVVSFLAADLLLSNVLDIFERHPMISVNGETHSGKTAYLSLLCGDKFQLPKLCECSSLYANYTPAGLRQCLEKSRMRTILDEFELNEQIATSKRKSENITAVLEIVRALSQGVMSLHGSMDGTPVSNYIRGSLVIAGITTMERGQDMNRFIQIRTTKKTGMPDPLLCMKRDIGTKALMDLQRKITLCVLSRISYMRKMYTDFSVEHGLKASKVNSRTLHNLYPAATLLSMIGEDGQAFIEEFGTAQMQICNVAGTQSESQMVWDAVLLTPIRVPMFGVPGDQYKSVMDIIALSEAPDSLHDPLHGVFYIEQLQWLVVVWKDAAAAFLKASNLNKRLASNVNYLTNAAKTNPNAVPTSTLEGMRFLENYVTARTGRALAYSDFSVYDMRNEITNRRAHRDAVADKESSNNAETSLVEAITATPKSVH